MKKSNLETVLLLLRKHDIAIWDRGSIILFGVDIGTYIFSEFLVSQNFWRNSCYLFLIQV